MKAISLIICIVVFVIVVGILVATIIDRLYVKEHINNKISH